MPSFSRSSQAKLDTCEGRLILVFEQVVLRHDCTVLCGIRSRDAQDEAYKSGASTKEWPHSRHNSLDDYGLSMAVDVAPYPIDWDDLPRFRLFAYYAIGMADGLGVTLRWGGDWDSDPKTKNNFDDLVHFELID